MEKNKSSSSQKNSRIAKNTIFLFVRSIITIAVALYTSRVVLAALGVEDFGTFVAVGSVVAMFSSISGSLSSAVSRFITYELGRGSESKLSSVFSSSVLLQIMLSICLFFLILFAGGWFLNSKMNIPEGSLSAANWVLVSTAVTFAVGMITVSYQAMIIAHERMKAFAYIGLAEVFLKLGVALLLTVSTIDKLKLYSVLLMLISVVIFTIYFFYCRYNFASSRFKFVWDTNLLKKMFGFTGWAFFSSSVGIINTQGINILMNLHFGVLTNAARGVSTQVENALNQLISNLTVAMNPQIIKSYAADEKSYMHQLICSGSKFSYFLALFFIVPLFIEAETVLNLWLKDVPEYATIFLRLTLLTMLPQVMAGILFTAAMATGNIRKYALIVNGVSVSVFFFAWALYLYGYPPETAYLVHLVIRIVLIAIRLQLLKSMIGLNPYQYFKSVILIIIPVTIIAFAIPLSALLLSMPESFWRVVLIALISASTTAFAVAVIGLTAQEKVFVREKIALLRNKFMRLQKDA
ncbi:oligosaccharide flippase family protein [Glaciecola sp. 2405UD65-10]|uniref:oligosaccharide flippase family protein n=1 Tax=Glaciecola sp. 2405UD65-10 TaxID=3397244 RepID=UPI003B5BA5FF